MDEYIKLFQNHTQYETYKNSADYITPNVSYCKQQDEVHYNPWVDPRLIVTFDINAEDFDDSGLRLYFDDFPQNICDNEYDGDMVAFKQDFINNIDNASPEDLNEYVYTGETYEYDGEEYYLWECTNEHITNLKYLLTDRLNFDGLSLEDNINANYCPFIYLLDEDKNITYDNTDYPNYYLVAVRSSGFDIDILYDDSNVDEVEIDGNILSDVVTSYTFNTPGEHIVKYTLSDPTIITESMFDGFPYLQSVSIPDSVITIEESAFSSCEDLNSLHIGNSVTNIGDYAFYGCGGLTSIKVKSENSKYDSRNNCNAIIETSTNKLIIGCNNTVIPNTVTSIGYGAFHGCTGLTSMNIPEGVTSISQEAFSGCDNMTSVTIPSTVTSIGAYAFRNSGLTSVSIPSSVTFIGNQAFNNCYSLTNVTLNSNTITSKTYTASSNLKQIFGTQVTEYIIGNDITTIGNYAFDTCSNLTSVTISNSVTRIGQSAFNNCNGLTSVHIIDLTAWCEITFESFNANPLSYAHRLYLNGEEISNLVIPNSVTSIGNYAFYRYTGLTSVIIPNSVTSIRSFVFCECTNLTSITIGNSVTSIEKLAFNLCTNLTSITCNATIAPTIDSQTFQQVKEKGTLYVPIGSTGYNVWMGKGNWYLGYQNWTKVEQ